MVVGMQSIHFSSLPAELIIKILLDVELHNLLACRRVCRFLSELIEDAVELRYKIALGMAGLEDGPPGGLTIAERLERVEKYQDAWRNLNFTTSSPISSRLEKPHSGGVHSNSTVNGDVEFFQIGSPIKGRQEMHWMLTRRATGLGFMCKRDICVGLTLVSGNTDDQLYLELWNWKSGIMVLVHDRHIMVTEHSYLAVHAFDPEAKAPCQPLPSGTGYVCALRLPPFDSSLPVNIQFGRDSNPTRAVHGMAFQHRLADSVRLLELSTGRPAPASCYICFFLSAVQACLQQASSTSQTWFAWEQWGPSGSRTIILPSVSYGWWNALGTLGTKCLFLLVDMVSEQYRLAVYEFNPWVVAGGPDAIEEQAVVEHGVFVEPVHSRVRCRIDYDEDIIQHIGYACLTEDGVILDFQYLELRAYVV
ncbi:hypothetical protein A0H81_05604 [Grifola frondosa]|uniref:F-box domain-containing protein n=1 Tax=Grifola frondosa TaxID=5627 RepID=A0A1C7MDP7_GRIFR|nr:hypothetical protein A0H81_05604 [Grifola frondosa]